MTVKLEGTHQSNEDVAKLMRRGLKNFIGRSGEPNQSVLPGPYEEKPTVLTAEQIKRIPFDLVRSLENAAVLALAEPTHASMPLTQHTDKYPMSDWRYEVANEGTVLGYQEWLDNKIEQEDEA